MRVPNGASRSGEDGPAVAAGLSDRRSTVALHDRDLSPAHHPDVVRRRRSRLRQAAQEPSGAPALRPGHAGSVRRAGGRRGRRARRRPGLRARAGDRPSEVARAGCLRDRSVTGDGRGGPADLPGTAVRRRVDDRTRPRRRLTRRSPRLVFARPHPAAGTAACLRGVPSGARSRRTSPHRLQGGRRVRPPGARLRPRSVPGRLPLPARADLRVVARGRFRRGRPAGAGSRRELGENPTGIPAGTQARPAASPRPDTPEASTRDAAAS